MGEINAIKDFFHPAHFFGSALVLVVNIAMAFWFFYKRSPGVSRYILAIMMVNMVLYISNYICCKLYYRLRKKNWIPEEGIRWITIIYGLMSVLCMLPAVYFFTTELRSQTQTPAASRNMNQPCLWLIFDNHDLWHFFSAGGLFNLFMFILTLEDNNRAQPRNKIPVF